MWDDNQVHVEGVSPTQWQAMLCKREGKLQEDGRDLAFQGLTFVPLNGASRLLGRCLNITVEYLVILPSSASLSLPYNEAIGSQLYTACIHWVYQRGLCRAGLHRPFQLHPCGWGAALCNRNLAPEDAIRWDLCPGFYIYAWPPWDLLWGGGA